MALLVTREMEVLMQQLSQCASMHVENRTAEIPLKIGEYTVLDVLGEGFFGSVTRCVHPQTLEVVAVKKLKDASSSLINEVEILEELRVLQPDKYNIVRFIECFTDQDSKCMAFETLDRSLFDFISEREKLLSLSELRPVAQQLLVAFDGLKTAGIIHADLKPDNIMLVNHRDRPFKVKLIDFGIAGYSDMMDFSDMIQPLEFRAPEATLGCKVTEAVDMWSLGCTLAVCFTGCALFSCNSPYSNLRSIIKLLGPPSRKMLQKGFLSEHYFTQMERFKQWRLKTPEEYHGAKGAMLEALDDPLESFNTLQSVFQGSYTTKGDPEHRDRMAFTDLIKRLLDLDYETRITPREALYHPFVTMEHLVGDDSEYSDEARNLMAMALEGSTTVSDLSAPEQPSLQVPQAVPEDFFPPLPAAVGTPNVDPYQHLYTIWDEPLYMGETSGTQMPRCLETSMDSQENHQHETSVFSIIDRVFMDSEPIWDEPLYMGETSETQMPRCLETSMDIQENHQHETSVFSIIDRAFQFLDSEPIWDEPLYLEDTSANQVHQCSDKGILKPEMDTQENIQCENHTGFVHPELICDEPLKEEVVSVIQTPEHTDNSIMDPLMNIQPEIWDEAFCLEETSDTPQCLDPGIPDSNRQEGKTSTLSLSIENVHMGVLDPDPGIPDSNRQEGKTSTLSLSIENVHMGVLDPDPISDEPNTNEDRPDHIATEGRDSAGSGPNSSFSIWKWCKTVAFGGLLAGQAAVSYVASGGSPIIAGAAVLRTVQHIFKMRKNPRT